MTPSPGVQTASTGKTKRGRCGRHPHHRGPSSCEGRPPPHAHRVGLSIKGLPAPRPHERPRRLWIQTACTCTRPGPGAGEGRAASQESRGLLGAATARRAAWRGSGLGRANTSD